MWAAGPDYDLLRKSRKRYKTDKKAAERDTFGTVESFPVPLFLPLHDDVILFAGTHYNPAERTISYVPLGADANDFAIVSLDTGTVRPGLEKVQHTSMTLLGLIPHVVCSRPMSAAARNVTTSPTSCQQSLGSRSLLTSRTRKHSTYDCTSIPFYLFLSLGHTLFISLKCVFFFLLSVHLYLYFLV